jgi:hypothetical protein
MQLNAFGMIVIVFDKRKFCKTNFLFFNFYRLIIRTCYYIIHALEKYGYEIEARRIY